METLNCKACGCESADTMTCEICGTPVPTKAELDRAELLDTLTTVVTAFRNWDEFKAAMRGGYCPTLRPEKLRKNASLNTRMFQKAKDTLAALVRQEGFKVWDGRKAW